MRALWSYYQDQEKASYANKGETVMDAREKAISAIRTFIVDYNTLFAEKVIDIPELEAYFREKFENEPGRLVVERECLWHLNRKGTKCAGGSDCPDCHGTGTIKRHMTRKEIEEWAYYVVKNKSKHSFISPDLMLVSGERVSVEEK